MRRSIARAALVLLVAGVALGACTLGNIVSEAQSKTVMISLLLTTPSEDVAGVNIPGKVAATVFLLTFPSLSDPQNFSVVAGADVSLQYNGLTLPLAGLADGGGYYLDSVSNSQLNYYTGANYRFAANYGGQTFAQDVQAPTPISITEFHSGLSQYSLATFDAGGVLNDLDAGGFVFDFDAGTVLFPDAGPVLLLDGGELQIPTGDLPPLFPDGGTLTLANLEALLDGGLPGYVPISAGTDLTLHRAGPIDGTPPIAIATVIPLSSDFVPEAPSYSSPALDATGIVSLVFAPSTYQQPTITIPGGSAWPTCPPNDYVLTVAGVVAGTNEGSNLFPGSTAFAGSADAAPAHCTSP